MSWYDLLIHLLNFVMPALGIALLLAVGSRLLMSRRAMAPSFWTQVLLNFVAGVVVLGGGLAFFGRDGMAATYGALVLVCGTVQWWLGRTR